MTQVLNFEPNLTKRCIGYQDTITNALKDVGIIAMISFGLNRVKEERSGIILVNLWADHFLM